jgi:hypothetical protein
MKRAARGFASGRSSNGDRVGVLASLASPPFQGHHLGYRFIAPDTDRFDLIGLEAATAFDADPGAHVVRELLAATVTVEAT